MVNKISVNYCFTIRVVKDGLAEYLGCVQGRCCCETNFHSVKVFYNRTILTYVIVLIAIKHFSIAHFFVEDVSAVCFVYNYEVIVRHGGHSVTLEADNTLNKALHSGNLYLGFTVDFLIRQALYVIDFIKAHKVLNADFLEYVLCLFSEGSSVNKKQNTLKAVSLYEPVDHSENGSGFTCAGSHGKQNCLFSVNYGFFGSFNSPDLIFTQV